MNQIALAQINPIVGDLHGNARKIIEAIGIARENRAKIVLFPELVLCGYPPDDFLLLSNFISEIEKILPEIVAATEGIAAIIGLPRRNSNIKGKPLFNSAAIIENKKLIGYQDKSLLPTYDVFDERRYFEPAVKSQVWNLCGLRVGVTICEDIWYDSKGLRYHHNPIDQLKNEVKGAKCEGDRNSLHDVNSTNNANNGNDVTNVKNKPLDLLVNLSASPFQMEKCCHRLAVCSTAAKALRCPVLLCNQVGGNDSLIFDGYSLHVGADGKLQNIAKGFAEDLMIVDLSFGSIQNKPVNEFANEPECELAIDSIGDLYRALVLGVRDYFHKLGLKKGCLGVSGGIDSAVVACIAKEALGKENVLGVMMPSRFSSLEGRKDAELLLENLGIGKKEISIEGPFESYLHLLEPHFKGLPPDVTEENLQARIRGMILMALSNKLGYVVLSTGNKSEMAMGYATLYGDMVGGLGVLSDVTKRNVYALAEWINRNRVCEGVCGDSEGSESSESGIGGNNVVRCGRGVEVIPRNIITKAPSAELRENQRDSDSLPDYEIVDNVLSAYVEYHLTPEEIVAKYGYTLDLVNGLIKKIHFNEYKRRQSAPGLRVSPRAFSVGRRFPIVQRWV